MAPALVEEVAADGLITSAPAITHENNSAERITETTGDFIFALG